MKAYNLRTGKELSNNVVLADSILKRMKGLLGKGTMPVGEALLIKPCISIHTFFMRFPIDAIFLNNKNRVIATIKNLHTNRVTRLYPTAASVLELPVGIIEKTDTGVGDEIGIA